MAVQSLENPNTYIYIAAAMLVGMNNICLHKLGFFQNPGKTPLTSTMIKPAGT